MMLEINISYPDVILWEIPWHYPPVTFLWEKNSFQIWYVIRGEEEIDVSILMVRNQ